MNFKYRDLLGPDLDLDRCLVPIEPYLPIYTYLPMQLPSPYLPLGAGLLRPSVSRAKLNAASPGPVDLMLVPAEQQ